MPPPSEAKASNARSGTLAVALAPLVVVAVVLLPWGSFPTPNFYSSAAQTIPVLLVALAVESSARELWEAVAPWIRVYTFVALAVGELAAIVGASGVIASAPGDADHPEIYVGPGAAGTNVLLACTAAGLVAGFLSVMYLAFFRRARRRNDRPTRA